MSHRARLIVIALLLAVSAVAGARRRAIAPPPVPLDARRSFAVTDEAILRAFSFERVMTSLAGDRALALYQQWFDSQNPKPGLDAGAPHCDDFQTSGRPSYNGFFRRCPTPEGVLANTNPFTPAEYVPLALINRFDMAPADGANCGQYRAIYSRQGGSADRINVIFEAVLPNPDRARGIAGCRTIAQFWADLSAIDSADERRVRLERFFFDGLSGFTPVFAAANYSLASGGGIRSLHSSERSGIVPRFYQFRLERGVMQPDILENMPAGNFFDATRNDDIALRFRDEFIRQIPDLAIRDVNGFSLNLPREFLIAESDPGDAELSILFTAAFNEAFHTPDGQEFNARMTEELRRIGSTLTPIDLLRRAETQTCTGCHIFSGPVGDGVEFPRSNGFEHVTSDRRLSPAMERVFIPKRMEILRNFLTFGTPPVRSN